MKGKKMAKKICTVCNGNGFIRVPYDQVREEQWADCKFCNNQGEIEEDEDDTVQRETNH
jgi:DnaJ-class molecular chaperone